MNKNIYVATVLYIFLISTRFTDTISDVCRILLGVYIFTCHFNTVNQCQSIRISSSPPHAKIVGYSYLHCLLVHVYQHEHGEYLLSVLETLDVLLFTALLQSYIAPSIFKHTPNKQQQLLTLGINDPTAYPIKTFQEIHQTQLLLSPRQRVNSF